MIYNSIVMSDFKMDESEALEAVDFGCNKPDIHNLRAQHPDIADILFGSFKNLPNVYKFKQGMVISWELDQEKEKNPTYGRFPVGIFTFDTGKYREELTVLDGELRMGLNGELKVASMYEKIIAPSNSKVKFIIQKTPVLYLCEYFFEG